MSEIQRPILLVLAVTLGVCIVAAVLVLFANSSPPGGAAVSAAAISSSNGYINELPYISAILAGGFVLAAMGTRRGK